MINPISFGSTYKIHANSSSNDLMRFYSFRDLCDKQSEYPGTLTKYEDKISPIFPYPGEFTQTLIVPDYRDGEVEAYCKRNGIKFYKKYTSSELLDINTIGKRIKKAPKDMVKVKVDSKKLEQLLSSQTDAISHSKKDYNNYYKEDVDLMIKSADSFPATTLYIIPNDSSKEDMLNYIKHFGAENLNDDMISLLFSQRTDEPDNCVYFGLKDLGMDKIPVYVDKDSYDIGKALKLF